MERVTLNGGQIVISGVDLTETQRDDLTVAFKETFHCQTPSPKLWPLVLAE